MLVPLDPARLEPVQIDVATEATGTFLGMQDELLHRPHAHGRGGAGQAQQGRLVDLLPPRLRRRLARGVQAGADQSADGAAQGGGRLSPQPLARLQRRAAGDDAHLPPRRSRRQAAAPTPQFLATRINAETTFDAEGFTRGEVSYWIPVILDSHLDTLDNVLSWWRWMTVGEEIPPDKVDLMQQLSSLLLFDLLTNNSDRFSGGNLMTSKDGRVLFWMDNTFGFQIEPEGHLRCRTYLFRCQKFSRKTVAAAAPARHGGAQAGARRRAGRALSEAEMASVIARRDVALRYVDGLVAQFGADKVLVFP